jgi:hypothetical protein
MSAGGHRPENREDRGANDRAPAIRRFTPGHLADILSRESPPAGIRLDGDVIAREAREATGRPGSCPILDPDTIVEVDPKADVVEGREGLGLAVRRRQQGRDSAQDNSQDPHGTPPSPLSGNRTVLRAGLAMFLHPPRLSGAHVDLAPLGVATAHRRGRDLLFKRIAVRRRDRVIGPGSGLLRSPVLDRLWHVS